MHIFLNYCSIIFIFLQQLQFDYIVYYVSYNNFFAAVKETGRFMTYQSACNAYDEL